MKVPTYRAQSGMTAEIGGRPMRVSASPSAFGADAARAMGQLGRQTADIAFALDQQRQREIAIEEERQRRIAEEEAKVQRGLNENRFKVRYTEAITLAAEEAALQPEDQQEAFFDNAVASVRSKIPTEFDDPVQQQMLDLDVEAFAVTKRVGVRRNAIQARTNAAIGVFAQRETQLIDQAIYGNTATERVTAENELARLYETQGTEYFQPLDLERRSGAAQSKISFEREILRIRGLESPEQAQAYIDSLEKSPPPGLEPTDVERLIAKAGVELNRKTQVATALRNQLKDKITDASGIIQNGQVIPQTALDEMAKQVIVLQDEDVNTRYNRMVESNENLKMLQGSTPAGIKKLLDGTQEEMKGEQDLERLRRYSELQEDAQAYLDSMEQAFSKGQVLDFLDKVGAVNVQPFDTADIAGSTERRLAELRAAQPYLIYDETLGPSYEPNFFTESEAQAVVSYINQAIPEKKASIAQDFQAASKEAPQIWEQIAKKNGQLFAMAGAIGDIDTARVIFEGDALLRNKTATNPSTNDYLPAFYEYVGNTYRTPNSSGENEAMVMNAALAHYAATRSNPTTFSEDEFLASINAVTGDIGEYNGSKLELPKDVDQDMFEDIIDGLNSEMFKAMAPSGVFGYTDEQAVRLIKNARIANGGGGVYYALDPGTGQQLLFRPDGEPLELRIGPELTDYLPSDSYLPILGPGVAPKFLRM